MTRYHAVMIDETGCEFGRTVTASNRDEAYDELQDLYPECRVVQLEAPEDTAERERRIYAQVWDDYDY